MDLKTLNTMRLADAHETKPHSPGWWNGRLASYVSEEGKDAGGDRVLVTLFFTAEEPLEGQDTKYISTNRRYPHKVRIYKEEDTDRLVRIGKALRPDLPTPSELKSKGEDGGTMEQYLEQLIGASAKVVLAIDAWTLKNRDREQIVVEQIRRAA